MRYVYLGDRYTRSELRGRECDPVLRPDDKVIRGRNRNQMVRFGDGLLCIVAGRHLRLHRSHPQTASQDLDMPEETFEDVNKVWEHFERLAIPEGAPHMQRVEMRKAFITGYWSCLSAMRALPDPSDAAARARWLEAQWEEVTAIVQAMGRDEPDA